MPVLNTTSPETDFGKPNRRPPYCVPSSRTNFADATLSPCQHCARRRLMRQLCGDQLAPDGVAGFRQMIDVHVPGSSFLRAFAARPQPVEEIHGGHAVLLE